MMPPVPGVPREIHRERNRPVFGMAERALPVLGIEPAQESHPAAVEGLDQVERDLDRDRTGVLKLGPAVLGGRLDGGLVLGESQLEANIGVQVDGPAALAIRRIQLLV